MNNKRIREMGNSVDSLSNAEFVSRFRMTKEEFHKKYQRNEGSSGWSRRVVPETANDTSSTRSNANDFTDGSSSNEAPNNAGSNTDPDKGKPEGKPKQGTAKPKRNVLNREQKGGKAVMPRTPVDTVGNMQQSLRQQQVDNAYQARKASRDKTIQRMGRRGSIGTLGLIGALVDGGFTYSAAREEDPNGSKIVDAAKAGAVAAGWMFTPGLMWSLAGVNAAVAGGKMLYEDANENYQKHKSQALHITQDNSGTAKGSLGGQLIDSESAYTMRQRSEQVMRQHKIATESILGSEARQLHR